MKKSSHPLSGQFLHFLLQFVQDMKVWLVLFGILLELDHTLVRALLQRIRYLEFRDLCQHLVYLVDTVLTMVPY